MSDLSGATAAVLAFFTRLYWTQADAALASLRCCHCSWFGSMHSATVIVLRSVIISSSPVSVRYSWPTWLMHCCLTVVAFIAASVPYFLFNTLEFGHPLKTGYDFWVPAWTESDRFFLLTQCACTTGDAVV